MKLLDEIWAAHGEHYLAMRELPDGRIVGVHRLLQHWTLHVGIDDFGYAERYCIWSEWMAMNALLAWNGEGHPGWWHKRKGRGSELCRDVFTGEIWSAEAPEHFGRSLHRCAAVFSPAQFLAMQALAPEDRRVIGEAIEHCMRAA